MIDITFVPSPLPAPPAGDYVIINPLNRSHFYNYFLI